MENQTDKAKRSLKQLCEINAARVRGYQNALGIIKSFSLKIYLENKLNEILEFSEQLNVLISDSFYIEEEEAYIHENAQLHQSHFYFTMAINSRNPRTVILSCQLGDKFAAKAYESALALIEFIPLPELPKVLKDNLSSIRNSFNLNQKVLKDAFI